MDHFDEGIKVLSEQRFTSCDTYLVHTLIHSDLHEQKEFFEAQEVLFWDPRERFFRHTVLASEVTAFCNRNTQIVDRPAMSVY